MAGQRSRLQEDVRFRVLRLLHDNPELSQRELAEAVGISNGSAHYLLSALVDKGLIKLGNFTAAADKRRYAYILTPHGIAEKAAITRRFLERKLREYEAVKAEIEALRGELDDTAPARDRSGA
ncbi:EPS-associated transcriptional regulator, MarR family [Devosia enhydra]|uniref:EPS-associated transcriptional regulator, MarR family n=1 Tax=Devosia enhydra TaxID=665118 RepID=A0A1K2I2F8_9HYPH|nr:MarR family EPS-associated transcriptional regulator [Devosia enhydra]SFZ85940.1 EPS-associated transcriptional regulator, MarR family [Devosia enhydra]